MGVIRALVVLGLVGVGLNAVVQADEPRAWVDTHGNQVPGELVDVTADQMVVLRIDDEEVSIPLTVFSENDRKYLRQQMPDKVSEPAEVKELESKSPSKDLSGADLYQPPRKNENIQYYCTGCDGALSSSIGVGDHCSHCGVMIEYEEDEYGNVVSGTKPPWFAHLPVRTIGFFVVFVLSTAWKFRRMLPIG
ncbi:hypothetical protein [Bremerella alba]|uniref:SLA1 homology domain-containing protein n=1 Tax=Bremerella alba TaxID=980252 RepID=A0A7V8V2H2_9BACT|nr:hypothetical protein [Bremerella alba]MBA2113719.1 hypothetical protein [Bremerella alba]